jgi:hypothetical protein
MPVVFENKSAATEKRIDRREKIENEFTKNHRTE